MSPLGYWICANGVAHRGACNCVTRPPKWIASAALKHCTIWCSRCGSELSTDFTCPICDGRSR